MKEFTIIYELDGHRWEVTVEHWTKEAARETFEAEHPRCKIVEIWEE